MLEVTGLTVRYNPEDKEPALQEVSFSLCSGERLALTGNNGAGKSTLLLALVGLLPIESGSIILNGLRLDHDTGKTNAGKVNAAAFRRSIGLVQQNPDDQLFMPSVYDDIAFGPRNRGVWENEIAEKADGVMRALGMAGLKDRLSHHLSGGEKRLAALAGVLVMEPELLLLDEPATFLDPPGRERLIAILSRLPQAMIIATHDLDMASRLCGRTLRLEHGRLQ